MVNYPPTDEAVKQEVKFYLQEHQNMKSLLHFYEKLYAHQRGFTNSLTTYSPPQTANREVMQGKPLLAELALPIPVQPTLELAQTILLDACSELLVKNEQQLNVMCNLMQSTFTADNIKEFYSRPSNLSLAKVQKFLFTKHDTAELAEQQLAVTAQVIRSALQMYFVYFAQQMQAAIDASNWNEGVCPVCGEKPMLAMLRAEDGSRVLECGLCHTQWEVSRIRCMSCGNTDHSKLSFFYLPDQVHRRVYVCSQCHNYLKTVVLKELARDIIPDLENLMTHFLDVLAADEGYGESGDKTTFN
ncbi:MAG TPA: formate dehydrogenase accessory protein FdhE [Oscillospiraceae bacterium]|nr:formate dehydrogenase accessory protein FdhE [Oscillospiraceae bacterium]